MATPSLWGFLSSLGPTLGANIGSGVAVFVVAVVVMAFLARYVLSGPVLLETGRVARDDLVTPARANHRQGSMVIKLVSVATPAKSAPGRHEIVALRGLRPDYIRVGRSTMFQPKVVLAPTDFSDPSRDAVESATAVASRFGSTLILVHVVPMLPRLPAGVSIFKEGDYEQLLREEAGKRIAELSAKCAQAGVSVQSEVGIANDVASEILRVAERREADLIVIATHGMTGWQKLVFGSGTEKVVRLTSAAVLVLRAPPEKAR